MKRLSLFMFLAVVGFLSGVAVGVFNTGLVPLCGDPCSSERLGQSALWGASLMFLFPIIGKFAHKKIESTLPKTAALAAALVLIVLIPAATIYGFKLHTIYWQSTAILGVPDVDYSYMVIATKPIIVTSDTTTVQIKAWERCVLGQIYCDKKPRTAEAMCLGNRKFVMINEADWTAFQRIPEEDLQGLLDRPKDMHLCAVP